MLFPFENLKPTIEAHGRRYEPFGLIPHLPFDDRIQLAFLEASQLTIVLGRERVGVIARQLWKAFAFLSAIVQILGLFFRCGHASHILALGGNQNLAQEDAFFADKFRLVLVVILL